MTNHITSVLANRQRIRDEHDWAIDGNKLKAAGMDATHARTVEASVFGSINTEIDTMPDNVDHWWIAPPFLSPETIIALAARKVVR